MSDPDRRPQRNLPGALPLVLLAAACTSACWLEDCSGLDQCDPTKQDCSLSITCCTPPVSVPPAPAPLTLACERHTGVRDGDDFAEFDLIVRGGTPPYAYGATFGDGESASGSRAGTSGESTRVTVTHTYRRPAGLEPQTFTVNGSVGDQAGVTLACTIAHPVNPARLDLDCNVSPRNGVIPLAVSFDARPSGCVGPCEVSWDFGDGSTISPGQLAQHVYTTSGNNIFYTHPAKATVTDSTDRSYTCTRTVEARPPDDPGPYPTPTPTPDPTPTPTATPPPANRPPVIASFTASPGTLFAGATSTLSAAVSDPDGDPITWTLTLEAASTTTGTINPGSGSGSVASQFSSVSIGPAGQAVIRLTISDGRGGTATATVTVNVILG